MQGVDENLIGAWTTDNKRYEDRSFEIQKDIIKFGIGNGKFSKHRIKGVIKGSEEPLVAYTISYLVEGNEYETFFMHNTVNDTIIFLNQKDIIWRRE